MQITERQLQLMAEQGLHRTVLEAVAPFVKCSEANRREQIVQHGIEVARSFGLVSERDIVFFVMLMFRIGPAFHEHPQIRCCLSRLDVDAERRAELLLRTTDPQAWEEAASLSANADYWRRTLGSQEE